MLPFALYIILNGVSIQQIAAHGIYFNVYSRTDTNTDCTNSLSCLISCLRHNPVTESSIALTMRKILAACLMKNAESCGIRRLRDNFWNAGEDELDLRSFFGSLYLYDRIFD